MLWLRTLLGKDDREAFARTALRKLSGRNPKLTLALDMKNFQIVATNEEGKVIMTAFLHNLYAEYKAAPLFDKFKVIENCFRGRLSDKVPTYDNYDEVRPNLLPRVRPRAEWTAQELWTKTDEFNNKKSGAAGKAESQDEAEEVRDMTSPYLEVAQFYGVGLCIDAPDSVSYVNNYHLEKWGVKFEEAMEIGRANLQKLGEGKDWQVLAPGLYASSWNDTHDASRILLPEMIRKLKLRGAPVAMLPQRNHLLVAGSEDPDGLNAMLNVADDILKQPRAMAAIPLLLSGDEWREYMVPPEHPLFGRLKKGHIVALLTCYETQKAALNKYFESRNEGFFVASLTAFEKGGRIVTTATWTEGVPALIPPADYIALTNLKEVVASGEWKRVKEIVGDLLQPTDYYPERYLVTSFPTPEQVARIGNDLK